MANEFIPAPPDAPSPPLPRPDRNKKGNVKPDIAEADKLARTGTTDERARDAPPSGAWNDTSHD